MNHNSDSRISIQVSLSGYSFQLCQGGRHYRSAWLGAEQLFSTPEFNSRYETVEISLMTPKVALVPQQFFNPSMAGTALSEIVELDSNDVVEYVEIPSAAAVLVYSYPADESLARIISQTVCDTEGNNAKVYPELYWLLTELEKCGEYNKILASYTDGYLHLVVAQGRNLLIANVYEAVDFTTAEYYIFLALKTLQLNPEVSTISFRTPLENEQEMSLYRYFKSVELL